MSHQSTKGLRVPLLGICGQKLAARVYPALALSAALLCFSEKQGSHRAAQLLSCLCQCGAHLYWHVYVEGKARQIFQMCFLASFLPQTHTMHVCNTCLFVRGSLVDHTYYCNKLAISMSYLILVVHSFCCLLWGLHLAECFVIDSQVSAKSQIWFAKACCFSALFVL